MEELEEYFKGLIPPPIIFCALVLIGFVGQWQNPIYLKLHSWIVRLSVGLPVLLASAAVALSSWQIMKKNKTAINYNKPTTKFIAQGPFRFTRNPLYLALLGAMATIAMISNSAWHIGALCLLFLYFNFVVVAREEKYLKQSFGEEYKQYTRKVRRWI